MNIDKDSFFPERPSRLEASFPSIADGIFSAFS
jgi:hypothetical protein